MKNLPRLAACCAAIITLPWLSSAALAAPACSKQSPAYTVALLELYTSEGCSSCPPADKFVSGLRSQADPANALGIDRLVPLALHVDYWDYIGWKDVLAKRVFTERQRWLSDLAASRTIYTPEIFIDGSELRNWRNDVPAQVRRVNNRPAQAQIEITLGQVVNGSLQVEVKAAAAQRGKLYVALYENALVTDIKAGENRGASLRHDYAVRTWSEPLPLSGAAAGGKAVLSRSFAVPAAWVPKNMGVAAFVQTDKGEVLQALALPLCAT